MFILLCASVDKHGAHIFVFFCCLFPCISHSPTDLFSWDRRSRSPRSRDHFLDWFLTWEGYRLPVWGTGGSWAYFFHLLLDRERSSSYPATRVELKSEIVQINGKKEERLGQREEIVSSFRLPPSFLAPSDAGRRARDLRDSKEK